MLSIKDVYNDYHEGSKKLINSKIEICGWIKKEKYEVLRSVPRVETPYLDTDAFAEYLSVNCRKKADP